MDKIKNVFATPILIKDWPGSNKLNERLTEIILERESAAVPVKRTNIGSWDSKKDFFEWPEPEVQRLKKRIVECVREITVDVTRGSYVPKDTHIMAHAWANVSRSESYRKVHNHQSSTWSGIYYVKSELKKKKIRGTPGFPAPSSVRRF